MFSPHGVEGALPSSSAKEVHQALKGKEKVIEVNHGETYQEHEDAHEEEVDFELVDLEEFDDTTTSNIGIKKMRHISERA